MKNDLISLSNTLKALIAFPDKKLTCFSSVPQEQQQDMKTKQINQIRAEYYLQKERKLKCSFYLLNLFAKETDC